MTATITTPATDTPTLEPGRWRALGIILIASFMVLLDTSIVTNGLATIQRSLGASYAQVQFVLTAYSVAYGMLLITGGRLGDLYGRKRLFLWGLAGFTLASAVCGLAPNATALIAARIAQGVAAALMFPQVSSLIQVLFTASERPRAFGFQGAIIGLGIVTGPLLGGLLIGANLLGSDWRAIFLVNVPIGLLTLALAARALPESRSEAARGLDVPGVLIAGLGLFLLTYPISEGREAGWPTWLIVLLASSLPVLGVFVWQQRAVAARQGAGLLELSLFRERAFVVGLVITFAFQSAVLSYFVSMALLLQVGYGFTPVQAALALTAYQITTAVSSLLSARLSARLGRNILLLGTAFLALGAVLVILTLRTVGAGFQGFELIPALIVGGFGFGCVVAPLQGVVLSRVNPAFAGAASGVLSSVQQVGSAVGVAVVTTILLGGVAANADNTSAGSTAKLERDLAATGLPSAAISRVVNGFQTCFRDRSNASDPSAVLASCRAASGLPPAATSALASATNEARALSFVGAIQVALRYQLAVYALVFALTFLLPTSRTPTSVPIRKDE